MIRHLGRLLAAITILTGLSVAAHAAPPWRTNYPLDGNHVTSFSTTLSNATPTLIVSTDSIRVATFFQIQCPASTDKAYISLKSTIDTANTPFVLDSGYFSPDDPIAWQGGIWGQGSVSGCKAVGWYWRKEGI